MSKEIEVAKVSDIPVGSAKQVEVEGEPVAIFNVDGNFYALHDTCSHAQASLSEGWVEDGAVSCPLHGATFNLKTGAGTMPAPTGVKVYQLKIEGDSIKVVL
ncbi:MAG: non-heme iron oxygenase ferredoxin subunit [Deltaproteobacteria bacterium]|nr:non-heme iron oxygenase ferredoxin subunit [Deltaproteobacteria bacterium]